MNGTIGYVLPTRWKGILFRSRIEARWAVFFDALGVAYEYEREGFDLGGSVRYLPDFWLANQQCWFEVKGADPTEGESNKAHALATLTHHPVYIFFGPIPERHGWSGSDSGYLFDCDGSWDCNQHWQMCPTCGLLGIEYGGYVERLSCTCSSAAGEVYGSDRDARLLAALDMARGFRFDGRRGGVA